MKKLYIPGKRWTSVSSFLREFPQAKTALIMLWMDASGAIMSAATERAARDQYEREHAHGILHVATTYLGKSATFKPLDQWTYDKKINAFRDIIRFAINPEFPMDIKIGPQPWDKFLLKIRSAGIPEAYAYQVIADRFLKIDNEPKIGTFDIYSRGKAKAYNEARVKIEQIMQLILTQGFDYLEITASSEWKNFGEMFAGGSVTLSQVPANTIAYKVVEQAPPIPKEVDWKNADFWSKIFSSSMGISILNAVVKNMPVKIAVEVTNWRDPNEPSMKKTFEETDKYEITKNFYTFVFQDFDIEVGPNANVLVKYNRGVRTRMIVDRHKKEEKSWRDYLPYVGIAVVAAVVAAPLIMGAVGGASSTTGATIAASAGGSTVASSAAGGAVVSTAAAPVVTAVGGSAATSGSILSGITLTGAAKGVSAGAGLLSSLFATSGEGETAEKLALLSSVTGVAPEILSEASKGLTDIDFSKLISSAQPLASTALQYKIAQEQAKLQPQLGLTGSLMPPVNGGPAQYTMQPVSYGSIMPSEIPMQYLVIGGFALLSIVLLSSSSKKRRK